MRAAIVTVTEAAMARPATAPVSASTPEGRSTATTMVDGGGMGASKVRASPVPKAASITSSAPTRSSVETEGSTVVTSAPSAANSLAATRPSAPFEPLPATTTIRRPIIGPKRSETS